MSDICELLLSRNQDSWDRMQDHRFVRDVLADELDRKVFARYLAFASGFVETAISIFGYALTRAPDMARKRYLIAALRSLALDQMRNLDEARAELGITDTPKATGLVRAFGRGMLEIAKTGSFGQIMTSMLAAQWMDQSWCSRAAAAPSHDLVLRRWVQFHVEPTFTSSVEWLKTQVREHVLPDETESAVAIFGRVLELEVDFHTAPYQD
ncbi:thiaminase (transcriptional activator TenA) [Arboricoccus pini]|uniref:Thiaminase (Transcriptional activator TenA) n=1 Tax=Arboricoccus pini TaxID=1963835 RepID=A0A212RGH6_9PROT|nr:TenA family protein [Arboricoccus pini]SNB71496.1 thiaminase (transcriptional activator TenA) [Arboricoccus pini]